jgi:hypothetical protein
MPRRGTPGIERRGGHLARMDRQRVETSVLSVLGTFCWIEVQPPEASAPVCRRVNKALSKPRPLRRVRRDRHRSHRRAGAVARAAEMIGATSPPRATPAPTVQRWDLKDPQSLFGLCSSCPLWNRGLDHVGPFFGNHDDRCVGVAGDHRRHDRRIDDAQSL